MQAESAPAQTGISAGGDYSGYTTGSDENNNATPQYAKDMTDSEKMAQSILKKVPVLGPLYSGVEFAGKFIQPGGSLMRRGESGMASAHGFKDDAIDEDGNPIQKPDKKGLISKAIGSASDSFAQQVNQQAKQPSQQSNQNDAAPQAVTPAYAGGSVDASMYGSGSGWGSSIAKFAKAKQGGKL